MLLLKARSGFIIFFMTLCMQNYNFAHIIDGRKSLAYKNVTEAANVTVEDVKTIIFDGNLRIPVVPVDLSDLIVRKPDGILTVTHGILTTAKWGQVLGNISVNYGQHLKLICDVEHPYISWMSRDKNISEIVHCKSKELDIKSVDLSYNNQYITCLAKWDPNEIKVNKTYGTHFVVNGGASPLISDRTLNETAVMENDSTTLSCEIIGGMPVPEVSWELMRMGDQKFRNLSETSEKLTIENATFANAGQYRCNAVNAVGQANKTIDVDVLKLPVAIVEQESENTFPYGNNTEFTCKVQGYPLPKVVWSDNQGNILDSEDSNINWHEKTSVLSLQKMKISNNYTCRATNDLGNATAAVNATVLSPFIVYEHPNETVFLHYGNSTVIVCNITSSFPIKIKWFRKTENSTELSEINTDSKYKILSEYELEILAMGLDMVGNHTCEASLVSDDNEKKSFTSNVQIDNLASPVLSDKAKIIVMEGNWVTLYCKIIQGVPEPILSWQAMLHDSSDYSDISQSGEEMELQNITMSDAGTYRCIAKNDIGETSKVYEIFVRKAPVVLIYEAPAKSASSSISVEYGSNHTFTCRVTAYPLPSIKWESNGKPMLSKETSVHEQEKNSIVTLTEIKTNSAYSCYAENVLGNDEQTLNVTVLSPFTVHQTPAAITNVHYAASTSLVCNITSLFPMSIKWYHNSSEVQKSDVYRISTNKTVLHIESMGLDHTGTYRCEASLVDDDNPKEAFTTDVQIDDLRSPVITFYTGSTINKKKFEDVTLKCTARGNPEPVVKWTAKLSGSSSYQPIGEGDSFSSTNVGLEQAGAYICTASNVVSSVSETLNVIVS